MHKIIQPRIQQKEPGADYSSLRKSRVAGTKEEAAWTAIRIPVLSHSPNPSHHLSWVEHYPLNSISLGENKYPRLWTPSCSILLCLGPTEVSVHWPGCRSLGRLKKCDKLSFLALGWDHSRPPATLFHEHDWWFSFTGDLIEQPFVSDRPNLWYLPCLGQEKTP